MEQITITGYVGKDLAITVSNGTEQAYFNIAVDKSYKKADGTNVEQTNWYTVWKKPSNVDKYIKKGTLVLVQGNFDAAISDYNGKQTIKLSIRNPSKIELLSKNTEQSSTPEPKPEPTIKNQLPSATDSDDLPF